MLFRSKSGESEYRLNDVSCRLKDIHNLFMDTGVSTDSYAIIELGMVDDIIKDKDEFTKGQLAAQFFGFRTQGLASAQEANFKAEGLRQQVMQEKRKLLDRFELEAMSGSDDAFDKALDKILDFNSKNPTLKVESKDLTAMIKKRAEIHAKSDRGFRVDKNLYPYLVDLLDVSRERIEREAARK